MKLAHGIQVKSLCKLSGTEWSDRAQNKAQGENKKSVCSPSTPQKWVQSLWSLYFYVKSLKSRKLNQKASAYLTNLQLANKKISSGVRGTNFLVARLAEVRKFGWTMIRTPGHPEAATGATAASVARSTVRRREGERLSRGKKVGTFDTRQKIVNWF